MPISTSDILSDFQKLLYPLEAENSTVSNFHPILKHLRKWLKAQKLSDKTIRNYLSDTRQFLLWLSKETSKEVVPSRPTTQASSHPITQANRSKDTRASYLEGTTSSNNLHALSSFRAFRDPSLLSKTLPESLDDFLSFIGHLQQQNTPLSSINRKLASLRQLAKFLHETFSLSDFSAELDNIPQDPIDNLLKNFRYHLRRRGHKSKTIANYLSDVKHYLTWAIAREV